uniref:Uncharacterized protein n=1 Tax=Anopheles maculatus TaxID=74869 RepID=A0A182SB34_9DIPT
MFAMVDRKLMLKIAHRLLGDTSKSPSETPPLTSCPAGSNLEPPASPPPAMMNNAGSVPNASGGTNNNIEYPELSRILCSFSGSDMMPTPEFVQVHQHMQNIIQHKGGSNVSMLLRI